VTGDSGRAGSLGTASRLAGTVAAVTDGGAPMSMFHDARPVTPVPVLVGTTASRGASAIRDFLSRYGYPFEWVDAGQPDALRTVLGVAEAEPSALPLCILPDESRLVSAAVEQVAEGLGMVAAPARSDYDLAIVGAGPAGPGGRRQLGLRRRSHRRSRSGGAGRPGSGRPRCGPGRCSSRLLVLVCTDRAATVIVPVTSPTCRHGAELPRFPVNDLVAAAVRAGDGARDGRSVPTR